MFPFILLYDISRLLKLGMSTLESSPSKPLGFQFVINISFVSLYELPGVYYPFLCVVGIKPEFSHKHCLFLIKSVYFFRY